MLLTHALHEKESKGAFNHGTGTSFVSTEKSVIVRKDRDI